MGENFEKLNNKKEDVLESKVKMINSLLAERDLYVYFHEELSDELLKTLKQEERGGEISLADGLSLVEVLEEKKRSIVERKDNIIETFDKRLDESPDIIINKEVCREVGNLLYGGELPVKVEYDDTYKVPHFNHEEGTIYLPRHMVISTERRKMLKVFIHELKHLIDLLDLPEDKDKLTDYLRSNFISSLHNIYEKDSIKTEKKLIDAAGVENIDQSVSECRQKIKDGRLNEGVMDPALKKAYEGYIIALTKDLFSYIKYANDKYEVSADNYAKEKAPEFTKEKIEGIIDKFRQKRIMAAKVSGFEAGSQNIKTQKELIARTPDRLEQILVRLNETAGRYLDEAQAGKDGSRGSEAYISAIKKILKKEPIFKKITRDIIDSHDPGIKNIGLDEDRLRRLVKNICVERRIEPVNLKVDDKTETSTYIYEDNTIYISRKILQSGDNIFIMRQLTHELGHAIELQNLAEKKNKDRYLDSFIYCFYKNELRKKADSKGVGIKKLILENKEMFKDSIIKKLQKPANLVDILSEIDLNDKDTKKLLKIRAEDYLNTRLLIETLNLQYRQDYYEMKTEKFSKNQAGYLTKSKIEELVREYKKKTPPMLPNFFIK